jgi:hypothetical protein
MGSQEKHNDAAQQRLVRLEHDSLLQQRPPAIAERLAKGSPSGGVQPLKHRAARKATENRVARRGCERPRRNAI